MPDFTAPTLSGDVPEMASSDPTANLGDAAPKAPPAPRGKPPSDSTVPPEQSDDSGQQDDGSRAPASAGPPSADDDDAGNPFVDKPAAAASPPGDDDEGNPFVDRPKPPPIPAGKDQLQGYVAANLAAHRAQQAPPTGSPSDPITLAPEDPIHDFMHSLQAGLQISTAGLAIRGKMPDTILPEHADLAMRIGSQIGTLAGDLPAIAAGLVAGGAAGSAAGTIALPVVGTVSGAAVGMGAGAFALPAAIRKMYIDHYTRGDISASDNPAREFVARLMGTAWEGIKGGTTGAAAAVTGGAVTPVAGAVVGAGAELAAMTTVGAAMEGRLPHPQEFLDGAILLGGLHAVGKAASGVGISDALYAQAADGKLRNITAATGETPAQIVERTANDIGLKQDIIAGNAQEPPQATPTNLVHEEVKTPEVEGEESKILGTSTTLEPKTAEEMNAAGEPPREPPNIGGSDGQPPPPGTPEEAMNEVLSHVGENGEPPAKTLGEKISSAFDSFYAKNVDYLDPINSAIQVAIKKGADLTSSAYDLGRLLAAHMDKTRSFLEYGTRDGVTGEINGDGMNQILRDAPDMDKLRAFGMAAHALELDDRGIQPWGDFNREGAQKVVDNLQDEYGPIHQRLVDFGNRVLDWSAAKGRYSPEQVEAMKAANESYSPSARVFDPDFFTEKTPGGSKSLKEIEGSARDIQDPILQRYKNLENLVKNTLVNEVRSTFVGDMDEAGLIGGRGPPETEQYFAEGQPNKDAHAEWYANEDLSDKYLNEVKSANGLLGDNQIAVYDNGERKVYEGTPGVIDSLKRLDGDATAMGLTSRILKGFSNAVRVGVVSNPAFGFAHFFRSQIMSSVYSKTGMLPFQSLLSISDFMRKSEDYQNWLYNGGASGSLFKLNDTYFKDNVLGADKEAPFLGKAWNAVKTVAEVSEGFIKLTDNLSRFTEYQRSVEGYGKNPLSNLVSGPSAENAVTPTEAAMRSRDVVPDYAKVGLERSVLRTGVAFIGAHINSLDRMFQESTEDPKGFLMKMSVISGMSAALWYVNRGDDAIDALPDWQKNTYWNFNVTRFSPDTAPNEATILRLPKPWAPGILFGSGMENALDAWFKPRPQELPHFAQSIAKSVFPELMPNMLQPVRDQYSNKQAFTGRPLVSKYQEELLPEMQYSPYTSETAKALGKLIGYVPLVKDIGPSTDTLASPVVVENYIKGWGGTLGAWALQVSDKAIRASTGMPDKMEPWENTPVLHQFLSRYPGFADQRLQDFYENRDESDRAYKSAKVAAKSGDIDAAMAIQQAHPDFEVRLDSIGKSIGQARKTYQGIQDSPDIPNVEKRQLLDSLLFQIGSMAKEGNQMMNDFRKTQEQNGGKAGQ